MMIYKSVPAYREGEETLLEATELTTSLVRRQSSSPGGVVWHTRSMSRDCSVVLAAARKTARLEVAEE